MDKFNNKGKMPCDKENQGQPRDLEAEMTQALDDIEKGQDMEPKRVPHDKDPVNWREVEDAVNTINPDYNTLDRG